MSVAWEDVPLPGLPATVVAARTRASVARPGAKWHLAWRGDRYTALSKCGVEVLMSTWQDVAGVAADQRCGRCRGWDEVTG